MPAHRRTPPAAALALASAAVAVAALAACGTPAPPRPWLADDLLADNGRFYTTCEDPYDEDHEKEVWLTVDQAAAHAEGQPCPDGPLRTGPHWEAPDARRTVITVPRPTPRTPTTTTTTVRPSVSVSKPAAPAKSTPATTSVTPTTSKTK